MENRIYYNDTLEDKFNTKKDIEKYLNYLLKNKEKIEYEDKESFFERLVSNGTKAIIKGYNKEGKKYYIEAITYLKENERVFDITKFSINKRLLEEGDLAIEEIIKKYEKIKYPYVAGRYAINSIITDFEFINNHPDKEKLIDHNLKMYNRSMKNMEDGTFFSDAEFISEEAIIFTEKFGLKNKLKEFKGKNKNYKKETRNMTNFNDMKLENIYHIIIKAKKQDFKKNALRYLVDRELTKVDAKILCERLKDDLGFYGLLIKGKKLRWNYFNKYKPNHNYEILLRKKKEYNNIFKKIICDEPITITLKDKKNGFKFWISYELL